MAAEHNPKETLGALKRHGVTLPRHPARQEQTASEVFYRLDTASMHKTAQAQTTAGSYRASAQIAMPRWFDPRTNFGDERGINLVNMENNDMRRRFQTWCRLWYATHPILGACVDIYARFPLAGMELKCDDPELKRFYTDLFLDDRGLDYPTFLIDLGTEYFTIGEAAPFGAWDEDLGIWLSEELLNPEDIVVKRVPLVGKDIYYLKPSDHLKELVRTREPREEYALLAEAYSDLIPYIERGEDIPVNGEVLNFMARKNRRSDTRGTSPMMRALKTLMLEDRLEAAIQATADRLYAPLTIFKLGLPDIGADHRVWIPSPDQLDNFRGELDLALSSDFRAIVTHFALDVNTVFGREIVPNYENDRNFLDERLFMSYGLSADMLKSVGSQPYASSALRIEFVNQMLSTYQGILKKHYRKRALEVAEAQGHFETIRKGDSRQLVTEDVLLVDENGEKYIEQRPKLLVPDLQFRTINLRDESTERDFLVQLKAAGVPIPDSELLFNIPIDIDEAIHKNQQEEIQKQIAEAEVAAIVGKALEAKGLVVKTDPMTGETSALTPEQDAAATEDETAAGMVDAGDSPADDNSGSGGGGRPNVSDEAKAEMPKAARKTVKKVAHSFIREVEEVEDEPKL